MKRITRLKTLILLLFVATAMTMSAQSGRSDDFFKSDNDDIYNNRLDNIVFTGLGNEPFGEAPVGNGLMLLVAAGAGYAVLKRKNTRKNASKVLMALILMLSLTQCKKNIDTVTSGKKVHITLNVNNGGRHTIEPNESGYVPVTYEEGDVIYVGNGGHCIGELTCGNDGTTFSGDITDPSTSDFLHFYFVGGATLNTTPVAGTTTDFTVDISNQLTKLPILSYAHSKNPYSELTANYSCTLENKCALVEFKYNPGTSKQVKVSNMLCEAKIDFANPGITPTGKLDAIGLYPQSSTQKWAILLPGPQRYTMGMVYKGEEPYSGITRYKYDYYNEVTVDELDANDYLYGDNAININISGTPTMNNKIFVVSHNGNAVQFARGNLQYQPSGHIWRMAANPWDYIGKDGTYVGTLEGSDNKMIADDTYTGWIDLFGWGTWGNGKDPSTYVNDNANYGWSTDFNGNLLGTDSHTDWRTITIEEFTVLKNYLTINYKIGVGTISGVTGTILVPESVSIEGFIPIHSGHSGLYTDHVLTSSEWAGNWESKGAVFLPCGGIRIGTSYYNGGTYNYYWTSTPSTNDYYACYISVPQGQGLNQGSNYYYWGLSLRLVR